MARGEIHVPLWVDYANDREFLQAGEKAELLFIRALCFMKRTMSDGVLYDEQIALLGLSGVKARAQALVDVGLWERIDGGWYCPSYLKRNKSRAEVEELAEKRALAGSKGGRPPQANGKQVASTLLDECKPIDRDKTEAEAVETARKRASRIPLPFIVSEPNREWAAREIPGFDWDKEGPKFVDYWRAKSGKDATKTDWDATWRNWMRRAAEGTYR